MKNISVILSIASMALAIAMSAAVMADYAGQGGGGLTAITKDTKPAQFREPTEEDLANLPSDRSYIGVLDLPDGKLPLTLILKEGSAFGVLMLQGTEPVGGGDVATSYIDAYYSNDYGLAFILSSDWSILALSERVDA